MVSIDRIIAFENGDLNNQEVVDLFQELVNDGSAWTLQGAYGRMAVSLIQSGDVRRSETGRARSARLARAQRGGTVGTLENF